MKEIFVQMQEIIDERGLKQSSSNISYVCGK